MRISKKYPGFLLVTVLLTAGGIGVALLGVLRSSIEREITKRGEATVESFAMANAPLMLTYPSEPERARAKLQFSLLAVGKNPDVINAQLADNEGRILASLDESEVGSPLPAFLAAEEARTTWVDSANHAYYFQAKVRYGTSTLGTFVLTLSRAPLDLATRRASTRALFFSGGVAAMMAIFALLFVRREVRTLRTMQLTLSDIAKGDFSPRMPDERNDEIGELAGAFNQMLHRTELFFHYVDKMVIDRLIADETLTKPGGRERDLAVVFGDMRGYTAMSNRRTADEVVHIVNTYFHLFIECAAQWGGIVDKTMGDAIMVVFERRDSEDWNGHTRRAVLALAYMKAASRVLNRFLQLRRSTHQELAVEPREWGFAMATGRAIVGNIGSKRRMDYTVCGRVVNLASRLEGLTKQGEVIVDNFTYMVAGDVVRTETLPPVQPKGFSESEKVTPHRIVGLSEEETQRLRVVLRKLFPFSFLADMVMPRGLAVGEQQPWCQEAERLLMRIIAETPAAHFFARADIETGRLLDDGEPAALPPSRTPASVT